MSGCECKPDAKRKRDSAQPQDRAQPEGKMKILVIEDDPAILRGLADNLRFERYEVQTASDGETGFLLAATEKPNLIVLDIMLPRLSGFDLCRKLRADGVQTPILMLTARSDEIDRVHGLDIGADDYVTKP